MIQRIIFIFAVFFITVGSFAQESKKYNFEIKAGLPYIQVGAMRNIDKNQMAGIQLMSMGMSQYLFSWGGVGIIPPVISVSPVYRYYINGHDYAENKNIQRGWVASTSVDFLMQYGTKKEYGIYVTPCIGYEFYYRKFFFQPVIKLNIPIVKFYDKENYIKDMWAMSSLNTAISSLSIGYRF